MFRRTAVHRFLLAAVPLSVMAMPACVLFLDDVPDPGNGHCHFSGQELTNCGFCVAAKCQSSVDGCCKASKCSALGQLDSCAGALDVDACTALRTPAGTSGASDKLKTCVASKCDAECAAPKILPKIGCYTNTLEGDPPGCACETNVPYENVDVCSESSPAGARCCADLGWPAEGLKCICRTIRCRTTADGCECSISESGPDASCSSGAYCCSDGISCHCGSTPCDGSYAQVASCSAETLPCLENTEPVSSCKG